MSDASFDTSEITSSGTLLARYQTAAGPRDVMAFNVDGEISLFDYASPAEGVAPLFIDRGAFWSESLRQLVLDYVEQSVNLGFPAVSERAVGEVSAELAEAIGLEAQRIAA